MTELLEPLVPADGNPVVTTLEDAACPTVRELLTELASLEDALRVPGDAPHEREAALAREQEIVAELHRRCPESPTTV